MRKTMEIPPQTYCHTVDGVCEDIDIERFRLKSKNISDLLKIQDIMITMEERSYILV